MGHRLLQSPLSFFFLCACFLLCCAASAAKAQRGCNGVKLEVRGMMEGESKARGMNNTERIDDGDKRIRVRVREVIRGTAVGEKLFDFVCL